MNKLCLTGLRSFARGGASIGFAGAVGLLGNFFGDGGRLGEAVRGGNGAAGRKP